MKTVIGVVGNIEIKVKRKRFPTLISSIVSQQISVAAARTIQGRLNDLVAPEKMSAQTLIKYGADELRQVGLSKRKAHYVLDLAQKVASGKLRLNLLGRCSNEKVIEELTQVKGIGVWTAQIFLMFSLGRLDVLPTGDLGIQKSIQRRYGLRQIPDPKKMRAIAKPWAPFETVACVYLWRALEVD